MPPALHPANAGIADYVARLPGAASVDAPLVRTDAGRVAGHFGPWLIESAFTPVADAAGTVTGHAARMRVRRDGMDVVADALFDSVTDDDELVRLDRLARSVHAINYFGRAPADRRLHLGVHARLLSAVPDEHGRAFQRVLGALGVPAGDVVIHIPDEANEHALLVTSTTANYRFRGFAVGLTVPEWGGEAFAAFVDRLRYFVPDILRVQCDADGALGSLSQVVRHIRAPQLKLMACGLREPAALDAALAHGFDLVEGEALETRSDATASQKTHDPDVARARP
jgi:EAL domain-containing protein (putative c-di-GMP-specific phosphodiesterase class I)